jgi:hypothetical protein
MRATHEDAGGDHGCGVDQRRNRGRAFHGIRQPGVQQELRRLAHRAHEQQQAGAGQRMCLVEVHAEEVEHDSRAVPAFCREARGIGEDGVEVDRTEENEDAADTEDEAEVADAVDDEGLHGGGVGRRLLEPEADQQIGGQTHAFPAEEHLGEVVRGDQHQHGEGEERQVGEEARTMRVVMHVPDRIEVDERRHRVDDDQHDRRQRIDAQSPGDVDAAGLDPAQDLDLDRAAFDVAHADGDEDIPRQERGEHHQTGCDVFRRLGADRAAEKAGDDRANQGKKDDSLI